MRRRLGRIVGIGLLVLAGCATGAGLAADLPQTRPLPMLDSPDDVVTPRVLRPPSDVMIPVLHPPDALIVAREPEARWLKRLNASLARHSLPVAANWSLLGLVAVF